MVVVMAVIMRVVVAVRMGMLVVVMVHIQAAGARAEIITQVTILNRSPWSIGALALHVVVVAFLHRADLGLKTQNLRAIFAGSTSRRDDIADLFGDPFRESFQHLWVVV